MQMFDSYGRKINYLRLSVTDLCNLRCRYCMPPSGIPKLEHNDVLSYEQLLSIAEQTVVLGVEKIRVTGGEPLVRKGLIGFLKRLSRIPGLKQLVLTTNGVLLENMVADLKKAGVQRLNVSLDSMQAEVFSKITRSDDLPRVLDGIAAAEEAGLPLKVNMVVMRGINDTELLDFAEMTFEKPYSVRFIEYMPVIKEPGWQSLVVPGDEILRRLVDRYTLNPVLRGETAGPAREYKLKGAIGTVGVITPLSGHFCDDCNRVRITAAGQVRNCLFSNGELDLKPVLARGSAAELQAVLQQVIKSKPAGHALTETSAAHSPFNMAQVGG